MDRRNKGRRSTGLRAQGTGQLGVGREWDLRLATCRLVTVFLFLFLGCQQTDKKEDVAAELRLEEEPLPIGGNFALTDQDGKPFQLGQLEKPVLLFFGYATCPDFCPQTLARLSQVYAEAGEAAADVATVFVSVDAERDTPDVLKTYLAHFDLPVIGLTGSKAEIDAVVKQYAGFYKVHDEGSAAGNLIDHSLYIYVIDREGGIRYLLRSTDSVQDMVTVIKQLS